jgi:hypothetical protein
MPSVTQCIRNAVFVGVVAVGGSALGYPVVAHAEPNSEWDIETYDNCMSKTVRNPEYCCVISGGVVGKQPGSCTAPAAVAEDTRTQATMTTVPIQPPPEALDIPPALAPNG